MKKTQVGKKIFLCGYNVGIFIRTIIAAKEELMLQQFQDYIGCNHYLP